MSTVIGVRSYSSLGVVGNDPARSRFSALRSLGEVVYTLRTGDGLIKIGCSTDLAARWSWYACHCQDPELLAFLPGNLDDESALHARFRPHRARGREWYHPTLEVLAWVNDLRRGLRLAEVVSQ